MTQYPGTFGHPYADPMAERPKTSGVAITAFICSLLGVIPCCGAVTAVLGVLLGVVAFITIGSNPMKKGKGLATAAIILGLLFGGAQAWVGKWGWDKFVVPVMSGPKEALTAGFSGNIAAFKAEFDGRGATASDAEAQAFIDELRQRYGEFVAIRFDDRSGNPPQGGQPEAPFPYIVDFQNQTVKATAVRVFADERSGQFVNKWKSITVHDSAQGDLAYPPAASGSSTGGAGAGTAPATGPGGAGTPR